MHEECAGQFVTNNSGTSLFLTRNTGPYRRVMTDPGKNLSHMSARLFLPGRPKTVAIEELSGNAKQAAAHVYLGGWGRNKRGAVDAGLQHSPTLDNWAVILVAVNGNDRRVWSPPSGTKRFRSNQEVSIAFEADDNLVRLIVEGEDVDGAQQRIVAELSLSSAFGWTASGQGCRLKRMVSIAQNGETDLEDGNYLCGVRYTETKVGRGGNMRLMQPDDVSQIQNFPHNKNKIKIKDAVGVHTETVCINLS